MTMRKSLDELEISNGKVVTRRDQKEFNGTIVSKYPTGQVRSETEVKNGQQLNTTTYDISGQVTHTTKPPLASKERNFGYEDVSQAYNHYHNQRKEKLGSHLSILGGIILLVVIIAFLGTRGSKST